MIHFCSLCTKCWERHCIYLHWLTVSQHELKVSFLLWQWEGLDIQTLTPARKRLQKVLVNQDKLENVIKNSTVSASYHRVAVKMLRIKMQMFRDSYLSRYQEDMCVWKDCFDFYHHKVSFSVIESGLQGTHCFITLLFSKKLWTILNLIHPC